MTGADDKVAEARAKVLKLAVTRRARKEELEAELARRKGERAEVAAMDAREEVQAIARDLDARIQALTAELVTVDSELRAALREADDLRKLGGQAEVAQARELARSVTDPDPILRSPEDTALDNVRAHIADLEAQVRLDAEVSSEAKHESTETATETSAPTSSDKPKKTW
jgi:hypothetical protein